MRRLRVPCLPVAALTMSVLPWWTSLVLGSLAFVAYIYRLRGIFVLASKALDKASPAQTAAIMNAVAGRATSPQARGGPRQVRHTPLS